MFKSRLLSTSRFQALSEKKFWSAVQPRELINPRLVHLNHRLAEQFGLGLDDFSQENFLSFIAGQPLPAGVNPMAMAYAGHQFGGFNPFLGDGRAMTVGEVKHQDGTGWEFQLKGSGPTPYSRGFDGRAVLRSVIREYLASEAMAALDIPTTRALCLIDSDTPVFRERSERGAMMIRVAPSHIRFGSFEYFFAQGEHDQVKELAEHTIRHHFPQHARADEGRPYRYADWFQEVVIRTAEMVADWQVVGFCHGVINTDNTSILGLTFDYGPYGFLETYDPEHICNHSDHQGRYAFKNQPQMGLWNCLCLAQALSPLISRPELDQALEHFESSLQAHYLRRMRNRLGLISQEADDGKLIRDLLDLLQSQQLDYNRFLRGLCYAQPEELNGDPDGYSSQTRAWLIQGKESSAVQAWLLRYQQRANREKGLSDTRQQQMLHANPKFILRNYLAQQAIEQAEQGDYQEVSRLATLLQTPYDEHPDLERYAEAAPETARRIAVSCSS